MKNDKTQLNWVELVKGAIQMTDVLDTEVAILERQIKNVKETGRQEMQEQLKTIRALIKQKIKENTTTEVKRLRRQIALKKMAKRELEKRLDINIRELALHADEPGIEASPITTSDDYGVVTWKAGNQ